jgi:hypothetical protein
MSFFSIFYNIIINVIALAGLVAYFLLPKNEKKIRIYLLLICALVLVSFYQDLASYLGRVMRLKNHWVFNVFFYHFAVWINLFILRELTLKPIFKKIILGFVWILFICSGLPYGLGFFPFNELLNYAALLGSSMIIISCGLFFYDLLSNDAYLHLKILRYSGFWIATLLLFFYSSNFVLFVSLSYIIKHHTDIFIVIVIIPMISSVFVYIVFLLTLAKWKVFIT